MRRVLAAGLSALLLALVAGGLVACGLSAPGYRGPRSDHFDGRRFHNVPPTANPGARELLRWQRTRRHVPWGPRSSAPLGQPRPPERVTGELLRVTWIGHATVLVQTGGVNLLTDPVFSERAGPFPFAGPRRHYPPGVPFEELPPIDVVVISHDHYDHMDLPTLRRLSRAHRPRIFAGLGTAALLRREGVRGAEDLDWWQGVEVRPGVTLRAVPAQHSSRRGVDDTDVVLWAGFSLEAPGGAVFFAGDTGYGPHFRLVRERLGAPRLAILPIGAYLPRWFMRPLHMDPAEALRAAQDLGARTSLAMHFGTFDLADEGERDPVRDLRAAGAGADFWVLPLGEGREVP